MSHTYLSHDEIVIYDTFFASTDLRNGNCSHLVSAPHYQLPQIQVTSRLPNVLEKGKPSFINVYQIVCVCLSNCCNYNKNFVQLYGLYKMFHHLDMKTIYDQKIHLPLGQNNMLIVVYKEQTTFIMTFCILIFKDHHEAYSEYSN